MKLKIMPFIFLLVALFGCLIPDTDEPSPDPYMAYYGTWLCPASTSGTTFDATIKISRDEFLYSNTSGVSWTASPITWTAAVNERETTKDEYPSGYIISGPRSDGLTYRVPYYLHSSKQKLSANGYPGLIFIKQQPKQSYSS
jgi:hypothetical protein